MTTISEERSANTVVAVMLVAGADRGFRSLDVFVTWVVAGTAAALGLAAANLDRLNGLVTLQAIRDALPILGLALLFVLIAKFVGSLICTMAGAMDSTFIAMKQLQEADFPSPGPDAFEAALKRATPWSLRLWQKLTGGRSNQGLKAMRLMMVSGTCALLASICTIWFWWVLLSPGLSLVP